MEIVFNKIFLEHDTGMHPENKKRLEACFPLTETRVENGEKYLPLFHTPAYVERVKKTCKTGDYLDSDTPVSEKSYNAAVHAVGATVMASKSNDFALVRPPGHHAFPDHSSGFCIFNNIAIAVQRLVNQGKRVLIFDFDSHLGDGTVKYFYNSDKVLYWSLHQWPAFPGGGDVNEIGEGEGKGYTINIPLSPGTGDDIYSSAVKMFLPVAKQFRPDAVAVSAGFDGHAQDLLLDLRLSTNLYHSLGKTLKNNFNKIFATLEGGYNTSTFPKCLHNFVDGVNGNKMRFREHPTESRVIKVEEFEARAYALEKKLSEFWKL